MAARTGKFMSRPVLLLRPFPVLSSFTQSLKLSTVETPYRLPPEPFQSLSPSSCLPVELNAALIAHEGLSHLIVIHTLQS